MAANIEQIFQDFILNKIREIEDQNEDKAYVTVVLCIRPVHSWIQSAGLSIEPNEQNSFPC